jgi:hypothetical protein
MAMKRNFLMFVIINGKFPNKEQKTKLNAAPSPPLIFSCGKNLSPP